MELLVLKRGELPCGDLQEGVVMAFTYTKRKKRRKSSLNVSFAGAGNASISILINGVNRLAAMTASKGWRFTKPKNGFVLCAAV